ncbi:MAG: protein phosphatase 2C domain-containing protein [Pseudomonadota bacterium]
MKYKIDYFGAQIQGRRDYQEDRYDIFRVEAKPDNVLAIVCDGMGGHVGGALAAETAVRTFVSRLEGHNGDLTDSFMSALNEANSEIARVIQQDETKSGMGCTLTALELDANTVRWISVGDSVLHLFRNGEISRLNDDHSMAPQLDAAAARGEITQQEALESSSRHMLRSAIMGDHIKHVDFQSSPHPLEDGDWLILASDGLDVLDPRELATIIQTRALESAYSVCEHLLDAVESKNLPRQDNTTVIAIRPRF